MMTHRRLAAVLAVLLGMLATDGGAAQEAANSADMPDDFDCVVEPKLTIKLGNNETGIVVAVNVDRDAVVKKGDIVAQLDSNLQKIAVDLARLKASNETDVMSETKRLKYRAIAADRATELFGHGTGSAKSRDEAVTERELAELAVSKAELEHKLAQIDLAQAQERLDRRFIRSPVNGVVADVTIKPGEYAYEQAPLMTLAEIDPLYVKVFVPVRYYRKLQVGMIGEVVPEAPIGGLYKAQVTVVDRVFDAASSTFGVRLELPNPDLALPAGMRCRVHFVTRQAAN